jgi:hypothetical protein
MNTKKYKNDIVDFTNCWYLSYNEYKQGDAFWCKKYSPNKSSFKDVDKCMHTIYAYLNVACIKNDGFEEFNEKGQKLNFYKVDVSSNTVIRDGNLKLKSNGVIITKKVDWKDALKILKKENNKDPINL